MRDFRKAPLVVVRESERSAMRGLALQIAALQG
jgi:hypothetical protein